jgi:hypothetical protein
MSKLYDRAVKYLEDADARLEKAPDWVEPHDTTYAAKAYWADVERLRRWYSIDFLARLLANQTVLESSTVESIVRLAETAERNDDMRAYTKAVAARIAMAYAIWAETYGRYMLKHGGAEFQPAAKRLKQYRR